MIENFEYKLLDFGDNQRLDSFAGHVVRRPAPQVFTTWAHPEILLKEKAVCERLGTKNIWTEDSVFPEKWELSFGGATIKLKPSAAQVGVFPEQLQNWKWIQKTIKKSSHPLKILNLFGYTGMSTLVSAVADKSVKVTHVDGAKSSIKWAKENAKLSGVSDQIRWICEDVSKFVKKEVKRGSQYDAIILDPPAFGRGPGGEWKIERDLEPLLENLSKTMTDNPLFVVLSCHHPDWTAFDLEKYLKYFFKKHFINSESVDLIIDSEQGQPFLLGVCGRVFN